MSILDFKRLYAACIIKFTPPTRIYLNVDLSASCSPIRKEKRQTNSFSSWIHSELLANNSISTHFIFIQYSYSYKTYLINVLYIYIYMCLL